MAINATDITAVCDNIESLAISGAPEMTGATTMLSEACEAVDVLSAHRSPNLPIGVTTNTQDLKEYFRRPQVLFTGTVPNGTRTLINTYNSSFTNIFNTTFTNGALRLQGVGGVRFTQVFTLQIAATPFHQGVFSLSYQYGATQSTSSAANYLRCINSATATNLPHVRLDVSIDTMVVLRVPYVNQGEYLVTSSSAENSNIGCFAFNQLLQTPTVTGILPMTYKILMHLEDLELTAMTPFVTAVITPQAGGVSPLNAEFENEAFPYSSGLSSMGRTLGWVARGVPSLATLLSPPVWALGKAAGALRSFGFSKNIIAEPITRVIRYSTPLENNVDVASPAVVLGPFASNAIAMGPQVGTTNVDEMSLAYVLSNWSQINVFSWSTGATTNTNLYATNLSPSNFWFRAPIAPAFGNIPAPTISGATANCILPSTLFSTCSLFRSWRGSFEFRFTFGKTKMHGGRVLCTFTPSPNTAGLFANVSGGILVPAPDLNGQVSPTGISAIFDIRDSASFTFTCPYTSQFSNMGFNDSFGSICLQVYDPLIAPATVAALVTVMVEVRAKPDFDLITPIGPRYPPAPLGVVKVQSGGLMSSSDVAFPETITTRVVPQTVGESVTSLKQLIMLPVVSVLNSSAASTSFMAVLPWYHVNPYNTIALPFVPPFQNLTFNMGGYIATHFAYVTGGTDVAYYTFRDDMVAYAQISGNDKNTFSSDATVLNGPGSSANRIFAIGENPLVFKIPAYMKTLRVNPAFMRSITWTDNLGPGGSPAFNLPGGVSAPPVYAKLYVNNVGVAQTSYLHRSASDDARAALYMGPVPLLLPGAVVAGAYDPDSVGFQ